jgi:perosamine synthetase
MSSDFIPVAAPVLCGNEKKYVNECLDEGWISSTGRFIKRFETEFAEFCGTPYAVSCCNGTAALHLALLALGIGPGDEVIVPTLTFVATANAVHYVSATPVFVDSEPKTWNLDPEEVCRRITPRTKAVIAVHLYGHPADMDALRTLCDEHALWLIEDAAEALGARYKGRSAGGLGDVSAFSFYGNKNLTTGEGGMCVTADKRIADKIRMLRGQGMDPQRRYWFPLVGYNYRMTNVAAAIGVAQLESVRGFLAHRQKVFGWYSKFLGDNKMLGHQGHADWADNAYWMYGVVLDGLFDRDAIAADLLTQGIETRPVFPPLHLLPPYQHLNRRESFPVATDLGRRGLILPTGAHLSKAHVERICSALDRALDRAARAASLN